MLQDLDVALERVTKTHMHADACNQREFKGAISMLGVLSDSMKNCILAWIKLRYD
jgi:hypothetical protein